MPSITPTAHRVGDTLEAKTMNGWQDQRAGAPADAISAFLPLQCRVGLLTETATALIVTLVHENGKCDLGATRFLPANIQET